MRLIVAGSRTINPYHAFFEFQGPRSPVEVSGLIDADWVINDPKDWTLRDIDELVTGTAKGPDQVPYMMRDAHGIEIKEFPANWDRYGKRAGYLRNAQMADYADALLLIWDGKSRGSANMKEEMEARGKPVWEIVLDV